MIERPTAHLHVKIDSPDTPGDDFVFSIPETSPKLARMIDSINGMVGMLADVARGHPRPADDALIARIRARLNYIETGESP